MVMKKSFFVHHVAWFLMENEWPSNQIDHKNRNPMDNRWENLRAATSSQNSMNRASRYNKFGRGVSFSKKDRKFRAKVIVNRRVHYAGSFACAEDAAKAAKELREKLHGEFHCHETF